MVGRVVAMQNDGRPLVMFGDSSSSRSSQFTVPGKNVSLSSEFLGDQKN